MSDEYLSLFSEPYSPSGNLAADGFRKLLGTPALDLLQTVVREAVQNSCDAAKIGVGPRVAFRLRCLTPDQLAALRSHVFRELPAAAETTKPLESFLHSDAPWVLEICDIGTIGLAGPTRADVVVDGEEADFVNFLRNVGSPRDTHQGGGTYGYGKTSLYLSSRCSTILVDSQTTFRERDVRRVMACHLGSSFKTGRGSSRRRFTGRHWWGMLQGEDGFVEPLEDDNCNAVADRIGLLPRGVAATGTTIMILDPVFMEEDPRRVVNRIQEALLWWFWPRMLETTEPSKRTTFLTNLNGTDVPVPRPESFPPLNLFAECMNALRTDSGDLQTIQCGRPREDLGRLVIRKGLFSTRHWLVEPSESLIPERAACIAVMRPVELVVRYFDGGALPDPSAEWAGVFITSDKPVVENAFAAAEPPAHDDWQPGLMPKGPQKTYVNVALQRIKEAARSVVPAVGAQGVDDGASRSLARIAETIGHVLRGVDDGEDEARGRSRRKHKRRQSFVSRPKFERLDYRGNRPIAVFSTHMRPGSRLGERVRLRGQAAIVIDGSPAAVQTDLEMPAPPLLDWRTSDGSIIGEGSSVELIAIAGSLEVSVGIVGDFALALRVELEDADS